MVTSEKTTEQARRDTILKAGVEVFLEYGYVSASVDEIVRRAGGSKRTVYKYFGNKEELFAAIIASLAAQMLSPLEQTIGSDSKLQETLERLGKAYLDVLLREDSMAIFRTVVSEGVRFPALAKTFFLNGPNAAVTRLSAYLEQQLHSGHLKLDDANAAARQYFGMIRSDFHMRAALGLDLPADEEINREVKKAVSMFLREYAV
ncbi:MAG: TetR/AcrR family transcriptional regulator [Gammaproteobacteria bacterium]|nr:TetR/AcrR family transcriptional regulator [Gammaproteobacteria bacterium]MBQ0840384.1 TetR/AcrR family transcriptional regulator [Gammaproteobacteria bacterium]